MLATSVFAAQQGSGAVGGGHAGGRTIGHDGGHNGVRANRPARTNGYGDRYAGGYWPLFGDDYDYDYGYGPPAEPYASAPRVIYQPMPMAPVTETAHPVIHEYTQPGDYGTATEREADTGPVMYLIAFHDNTIRAAMTYWVDNGTLHYLDRDHREKQAPISSVDRDLSAQLNRERHIPFNVQ
jgi:hypothetical protein